ncbi:hypothetical protein HMPREF0379_0155 [[Eubacterium] yurii subsp. margaretiae ATCC 43715]|nr:hypothetical protein HMPREF0379_0155 [[Eubacterium] yurii subsp. margaretiae ATCC 43715]
MGKLSKIILKNIVGSKFMEKIFWVVDLILPVCMLILSFYYKRKATQNISIVSGFRTSKTLSDRKMWEKAHFLASKLLLIVGIILIITICLIKVFIKMKPEYLSLINNMISLTAFIFITIYVNYKISK